MQLLEMSNETADPNVLADNMYSGFLQITAHENKLS